MSENLIDVILATKTPTGVYNTGYSYSCVYRKAKMNWDDFLFCRNIRKHSVCDMNRAAKLVYRSFKNKDILDKHVVTNIRQKEIEINTERLNLFSNWDSYRLRDTAILDIRNETVQPMAS